MPVTGASTPLGAEHFAAIADAQRRGRKIRRCANVAAFSGWTMAIFAVITLATAIFGDLVALILGLALGGVAFNELKGGLMVKAFDPRGARRLAHNQIALGVLISGYAGWMMATSNTSAMLAQVGGTTGDKDMDAMMHNIGNMVTYGLYGTMIAAGVIVPGLTAWYYWSRGRLIRDFVSKTPAWVVEALRAVG